MSRGDSIHADGVQVRPACPCPNCGRRDTAKPMRDHYAPDTGNHVTQYTCTRCCFRWVTLRRLIDDAGIPPDMLKGGAVCPN